MSVKVELVNILTTYNIQPIRRLHNPKSTNLGAERWQVIQAASKDLVHRPFIFWSHFGEKFTQTLCLISCPYSTGSSRSPGVPIPPDRAGLGVLEALCGYRQPHNGYEARYLLVSKEEVMLSEGMKGEGKCLLINGNGGYGYSGE
jgi:hypothetical protein